MVSPLHARVLGVVAATEAAYAGALHLRLEGGTALAAYHLHHRESADLDVFGDLALNARDFAVRVTERLAAASLQAKSVGPSSEGFAELTVTDAPAGETPLRLQLVRGSPFRLAPTQATTEGLRVASFRDLCAGKFHAVCDRFEPRDFIDVHVILRQPLDGPPPTLEAMGHRFRAVIADLMASDPGLTPQVIGPAFERALHGRLVSRFPLRLLVPLDDDAVDATVVFCCEEMARLVASGWHPS